MSVATELLNVIDAEIQKINGDIRQFRNNVVQVIAEKVYGDSVDKLAYDAAIEKLSRDHQIECEGLTAAQLAEAIHYAINCGDFKRFVTHHSSEKAFGTEQRVTYVPHRAWQEQRNEIEKLRTQLAAKVEKKVCVWGLRSTPHGKNWRTTCGRAVAHQEIRADWKNCPICGGELESVV